MDTNLSVKANFTSKSVSRSQGHVNFSAKVNVVSTWLKSTHMNLYAKDNGCESVGESQNNLPVRIDGRRTSKRKSKLRQLAWSTDMNLLAPKVNGFEPVQVRESQGCTSVCQ